MTAQVLTANRLIDGDVVYFTSGGSWGTRIEESQIARDKEAAAELEAVGARAVADRVVVAPYLIDVGEEDGGIVPLRYRERIRAYGPSNRPDLAKHATAS